MPTKREKQAEFQKQYNALGFNNYLLGDEVITHVRDDGKVEIRVRKQINADEAKNFTLIFDTQTQVERLFGPIMKGLMYDYRR